MDVAQPPIRKKPVQREWCLHRGVKRFATRAVAVPHIFVNWDRSQSSSAYQHIGEKERGAVKGWPDTGLFFAVGRVFFCELKAPINRPDDAQMFIGNKLAALHHHWAWADTVTAYAVAADASGVPLTPNWREVAAYEDAMVAGDVRKQEAKAGAPSRGPRKSWGGKPRRGGISTAMMAGLGRS